ILQTVPGVKSAFESLSVNVSKFFGSPEPANRHYMLNVLLDVVLGVLVGGMANWLIWNALSENGWGWGQLTMKNPFVGFWKALGVRDRFTMRSLVNQSITWVVYGLAMLISVFFALSRGLLD